jgi:hypothetical protein
VIVDKMLVDISEDEMYVNEMSVDEMPENEIM